MDSLRFFSGQDRFTTEFMEAYSVPDSEDVATIAWECIWKTRAPEKKKDPQTRL